MMRRLSALSALFVLLSVVSISVGVSVDKNVPAIIKSAELVESSSHHVSDLTESARTFLRTFEAAVRDGDCSRLIPFMSPMVAGYWPWGSPLQDGVEASLDTICRGWTSTYTPGQWYFEIEWDRVQFNANGVSAPWRALGSSKNCVVHRDFGTAVLFFDSEGRLSSYLGFGYEHDGQKGIYCGVQDRGSDIQPPPLRDEL